MIRIRKPIISLLVVILVPNVLGQQEQRSVLLQAHEVKAVSDRYSSDRLERYDGSWQPTKADLDGLDANLSQISNMKIYGWDSKIHIDHPDRYFQQYVAVLVSGKRKIFVNAFCDQLIYPDWRDRLVVVSDGDVCFWQALYDTSRQKFSNLRINSRA